MEPKYTDKVIQLLGIFILFCAMLPNKNPYMGHKSYRLDRWIVMNVVKGQSELLKTVLQCFPMFSPHFSIFSIVLPCFPMFLQHFPIFSYVCFYHVFPYFPIFFHVLPVFYSILPFNSRSEKVLWCQGWLCTTTTKKFQALKLQVFPHQKKPVTEKG